jgi:hypothetical protein
MLFGMELGFSGAEWIYIALIVVLDIAMIYMGRNFFKKI